MRRDTRSLLAAAGTVLLLLAVACRSGDPQRGDSAPSTTSSSTASGSTAPSAPASGTGSPTPTGAPATAQWAYAETAIFMLPSGNLGCFLSRTGVGCQVGGYTYTPPPADCDDGDWGGHLGVAEGAPSFACTSDTFLSPEHPQLRYGESLTLGRYRCASRQAGVTCENTATGRGFLLSRGRYAMTPEAGTVAPAAADPVRYAQTAAFASPTGNIGCLATRFAGDAFVQCRILDHDYRPPPRDADCTDGEWGSTIVLGNEAYFACGDFEVEPRDYAALAYGGVFRLADVTCRSEQSGVTCADGSTGHRLLLSRERYELS